MSRRLMLKCFYGNAVRFFILFIIFEFEEDIFVRGIGSSFFQLDVFSIELLNDELPNGRFGIRPVESGKQGQT